MARAQTISFDEFIAAVTQHKLESLYLILGEEDYLRLECVRALEQHVVEPALRALNVSVLYADETPADTIAAEASTLPFLGNRRLLIVRNAQKIKLEKGASLTTYLTAPLKTTCLAIEAVAFDKRTTAYKTLSDACVTVDCSKLKRPALQAWVRKFAQNNGKKISSDAVETMIELGGNTLTNLENSVTNVSNYVGARKELTSEDVLQVVAEVPVESIFALTNAIAGKDCGLALKILHQQLLLTGTPMQVLGVIDWQFRRFYSALHMQRRGMSPFDIGKKINLYNQRFRDEFFDQLRNFTLPRVSAALKRIVQTELGFKKSWLPDEDLAMELLIITICSPEKTAARQQTSAQGRNPRSTR